MEAPSGEGLPKNFHTSSQHLQPPSSSVFACQDILIRALACRLVDGSATYDIRSRWFNDPDAFGGLLEAFV
jgi:hypothetical protein